MQSPGVVSCERAVVRVGKKRPGKGLGCRDLVWFHGRQLW